MPIWGPITPGNKEWFSPNVLRYGYSIERAREILGELGLTNRDADEWLEDKNNTEARFTVLTYRGNSSLERGAAVLRDELRPLGIAVDVVTLEQGAVVQRMLKGDFESAMFFFSFTNLDPSMNQDFWLSSGSAHIWNIGQTKPATDWEKEIDDLMREHDGDGRHGRAEAALRPGAGHLRGESAGAVFRGAAALHGRLGPGRRPRTGDPSTAVAVERRPDHGAARAPLTDGMGRYLLRRLGFALLLVFVVSSAALLLTQLAPGDVASEQAFAGSRGT